MTDLTPTLSTLLVEKHSGRSILKDSQRLNTHLDNFVTEARQINTSITSLLAYLRAIRQPYLSTAPPPRTKASTLSRNSHATPQNIIPGFGAIPTHLSDSQREQIDHSTSILLRDINSNITNLNNAAKLQHDTQVKILEKRYGKPKGLLWMWAAGADGDESEDANSTDGKSDRQQNEEGEEKTRWAVREGVIWFLNRGLKEVVSAQGEMVEIRLDREREKRRSDLWDEQNRNVTAKKMDITTNGGQAVETYGGIDLRGKDKYDPALADDSSGGISVTGLTPEQLQLFEEENNSLLNYYTDTLAKVTKAEKSLIEISSLQQTLVGHLNVQGEMIDQLVEDASTTGENLKKGNKELKKASERGSTARMVFVATTGLCGFLIVWDLIF